MEGLSSVRVVRSGLTESVHLVDVAVCDYAGNYVAWAGDPMRDVFARSCMKPLQAAVSLSISNDRPSPQELAVMCASHNGEPVHVSAVGAILGRAGLDFGSLRNPASWPMDEQARAEVGERAPEYGDCSGKHAGMLMACVRAGWDTDSYREADHPLQRNVLEAVRAWTGVGRLSVGIDGCGVPVHAMPLASMATLYARLVSGAFTDGIEPEVAAAAAAMRAEPYMVAGRLRVDTDLMRACPDVVTKGGAEGLICTGIASMDLGVAIKVADGSFRAAAPALIEVLFQLGVLSEEHVDALRSHARPAVLGGGLPVGEMVAEISLQRSR
jgi:L-asparaginase II